MMEALKDFWENLSFATFESRDLRMKRVLRPFQGKDVFIYGAGGFGCEMYNLLLNYDVNIIAFLDQNAHEIVRLSDTPVLQANDQSISMEQKENSIVFLSIVASSQIVRKINDFIQTCGFQTVLDSQSIRAQIVDYDDDHEGRACASDYYLLGKEKIDQVANMFGDKESLSIYFTNLRAHLTRDYSLCGKSSSETQYFPNDISFKKGYRRFIDGGSFVGDTIEELVEKKDQIEAIVAFEPDIKNYLRMSNVAERLKHEVKRMVLYPCALSDKTEILSFQSGIGSGAVATMGEDVIQAVALDDCLKNFCPSFIKMDVEGAELKALKGAQRIIKDSQPDLAVCVYHCVNHLWDIPLLLDSWGMKYDFYLRTYSTCTMETVLYATTD